MTDPIRCQCKGCSSCAPTRGECGRGSGHYPGENYCKECHDDAARVAMDAQPRGDFGMNAVLAAWHHRRTQHQHWVAAALTAQGFEIAPFDTRMEMGAGSYSIGGQQPGVDDLFPRASGRSIA